MRGTTKHRPTFEPNSHAGPPISFYVMGDTPRDAEDELKLRVEMAELDPEGESFLFHLGNVRAGGISRVRPILFKMLRML